MSRTASATRSRRTRKIIITPPIGRNPRYLTWLCHEGRNHHCGRCGTCVERPEVFHLTGLDGPTEYDDHDLWRTAIAGKGAL